MQSATIRLPREVPPGANIHGRSGIAAVTTLPDLPDDCPEDEPWTLAGLQPQPQPDGRLGIALTLSAPPAARRQYQAAYAEAANELCIAMEKAHGEFMTVHQAGRRLAALRDTIAQGQQKHAQAQQAETELRAAVASGQTPENAEERLRAALIDVQVYSTKLDAAREALPHAEAAAAAALREHVQAVRVRLIAQARQRIDAAAARVTEIAATPVLELAQAIGQHHIAHAPVPAELLQLPS